ncbi:hypothetical protein [Nocardia aurea]|uniref:hypothetical protein n=1 Tax=Nocardia aurea TaxID=2144174 RepID=UPI0013009C30
MHGRLRSRCLWLRGCGPRSGRDGDLLVRQRYTDSDGRRAEQRESLELKVWRDGRKDPLEEGLAQLDGYLDRMGLTTGILVIFDRRTTATPITERTRFDEATSPTGRQVTLLRA